MDYLQNICSIIFKLQCNDYIGEAEKIRLLRDSASVGSELLMSVTHELLSYINSNNKINNLIGGNVIELKNYCWSIGLQVR